MVEEGWLWSMAGDGGWLVMEDGWRWRRAGDGGWLVKKGCWWSQAGDGHDRRWR